MRIRIVRQKQIGALLDEPCDIDQAPASQLECERSSGIQVISRRSDTPLSIFRPNGFVLISQLIDLAERLIPWDRRSFFIKNNQRRSLWNSGM